MQFIEHQGPIRLSSSKGKGAVFTKLMKIPDVQMIYVSALACTRHRNIDFIEMQRKGRLSFLLFSEVDMITGDYITKTKEAAAEIAAERAPSGIILLTGCQSALLSTDYKLLSEEIEQEIGIPVRVHDGCRLCGFDEEAGGSSAIDQLLYSFLRPAEKNEELSVNILGGTEFDRHSELFSILENAGVKHINTLDSCETFQDYQNMATAHLNILTSPQDLPIGAQLEETLHIPYVCLGGIYGHDHLESAYRALSAALNTNIDTSDLQNRLADKLQVLKQAVDGRSIIVEDDAELARWLLTEGFPVVSLALNPHQGMTPEQHAWFAEHAADCKVESAKRGPGGHGHGGGHGHVGGHGKPGGGHGHGGNRRPGGREHGAAALKLGYAGSMAALAALEHNLGGTAR